MKKVLIATILTSFMLTNITPVLAVEDIQKSTATPKQYKSMVKKNKKVSDDYKYAYVNIDWWKNFNDPNLNNYIALAIQNNHDLKMASLAVEEYYQQSRASLARELPSATIGFSPNLLKMPGATNTVGSFVAPAMVQYELDLFLKNRDKTRAMKKLWEGSQIDERAAYISIASSVGATYLNVVKLDKLISLQENIVKNRKEIYDLMLLSNNEGITSTADTVRANKAYIAGVTDLIELQKNREKLLHQLCVLIGISPEKSSSIERISLDELQYTGNIPSEIASEIIVQRPDYLKAEKMVEKAGIDVRVAKKEFLPSITLSGIALFNSHQFGSIFSTKGMLAALGGSAMLPLFTGGAKIANLKIKKATYERILHNYYKTNLTAIQEVNDSLVTLKMDQQKLEETTKQTTLEKAEYDYNQLKYDEGIISKLDLIQVEENLLMMNKLLASNTVDCMVDYIGLYKASGSKL